MRILVVSNLYPPVVHGGYEVECDSAVRSLRERGDDVRVLTRQAPGAEADEWVARELHHVPETDRATLAAPLTTLLDRRAMRRHLHTFAPDLVFVWNGAQIPHAAIQEALVSGTPTAFRVCEHWFGRLFSDDRYLRYLTAGGSGRRSAWSRLVRGVNHLPYFGLRRSLEADVAISWVSEFLREAVPVPAGLRPKLERVIAPTTERSALFGTVRRDPSTPPTLAFAGRLSREKGADVAIAALGRLARDGRDVRLVLAGPGSPDDLARLRRDAEAAGVLAHCEFPGSLGTEALCALFARASALLIPSVWLEPLPITAIEGALSRTPIVASRVGGIPEALVEGEEALLATPGDADELAGAIAEVLSRPDEARARAERAYRRWSTHTLESYAQATRSFVDDALQALTV